MQCKKCKQEKDLGDFYKHPQSSTGYDSSCKECRKELVRINRDRKKDYYRAYDKERFKSDPRVRARHKKYASTEAGKEASNRARYAWAIRNAKKKWASSCVRNAVRDGKIFKPSNCSNCGKSDCRIEGHHNDYDKPLDVVWLCSQCHTDWHMENGEALNPK